MLNVANAMRRDATQSFIERLTALPESPSGGRTRIVEVEVPPPGETLRNGAWPSLPVGLSDADARQRLLPLASERILRLTHAHGLLCGLSGDDAVVTSFNRLATKLLTPPPWCSTCFQKCHVELQRWLDAAAIAKGADGPNRWCARFEPPAALLRADRGCPTPSKS